MIIFQDASIEELADKTAAKVLELIKGNLPKPDLPESYLTRKEAAKLLRLSLPTLGSYCAKQLIPSYRIGSNIRFKKSDIEKIVSEGLRYGLKKGEKLS